MIRLNNVSKDYAAPVERRARAGEVVHALREVSLEIREGEFATVMGPSGCGKSTLLHLMAGLDTPTSGEVRVGGQEVHRMGERALSLWRRSTVGVVFQFFNLLPQLTALENVSLTLRLQGVPEAEAGRRAEKMLAEVGLGGKEARLPAELSGGEQQRVAIARALLHHPSVLLADEPTGNLDSASSEGVLGVLRAMHRSLGMTLVLVTHSEQVARAASRTLRMQDGRVLP